jgi:oxygen-dependent protoporphyrinogen oxidase
MHDIAIVGAGLAGLAAGWELQQAGLRVAVFEQSSRPGGRARTERADAFLIETGAQFVLDIYERMQMLCRRAGTNVELRRVRGGAGVVRLGRFHPTERPSDFATSGLLSLGAKLGLARLAHDRWTHRRLLDLYAPERAAPLDDESCAAYVRRLAGAEVLEYAIQPALSAFFFWTPERVSRGYATILLDPEERHVYAPVNGYSALVDALAAPLDLRVEHQVRRIYRPARAAPFTLEVATAAGIEEVAARAVICAVPAPCVLSLLPDLEEERRQFFARLRYSSTIVVALGVSGRLSHAPYGYHLPRKEFQLLAGVTVASAKAGNHVPPEQDLLTAVLAGDAAARLLGASDEAIVDAIMPELRLPGLPADLAARVRFWRVYRHALAAPEFDVGHLRRLAFYTAGKLDGNGLYFAGDYLLGPFAEGAVRTGRAAARRALSYLQGSEAPRSDAALRLAPAASEPL